MSSTNPTPTGAAASGPRSGGLPRVLVVLVGAAALVIALAGVQAVSGIVGPAFLALVLTLTVHPFRLRLTRWGLPEWLASIVTLIAAYLLIVLISVALVVSIARLAALLPTYTQQMTDTWDSLVSTLGDLGVKQKQIDAVVSVFDWGSLVGVVTDLLGSVLSVLSNLFFIATLLLFIVFDTGQTGRVMTYLRPQRPDLVEALYNFGRGTFSYMAVSASFGLIVAIVDGAALALMGVPGAFIWAVLAFVTNFIPNIGFVIGVIPPAVIALLEGGPGLMVAVIVVYSVINFVIQSVIQPRVVGDRVGLSATVTFLSLIFWAWALGALGALLAVPLTLLLKAVLIEADPDARWALPLISGKVPEPAADEAAAVPDAPAATAAPPSDA